MSLIMALYIQNFILDVMELLICTFLSIENKSFVSKKTLKHIKLLQITPNRNLHVYFKVTFS